MNINKTKGFTTGSEQQNKLICSGWERTWSKTEGFTLFIALVISSTLLLVSVGLVNLAVRGALISSLAKESQNAFYAADTGVECALYWDVKNPGRNNSAFIPTSAQNITCNGTTLVNGSTLIRTRSGTNATSTFSINFTNFSETYCATVSVAKVQTGSTIVTKIESKGYNKSCTTSDPRRVERAVRVTY